MYVSPVRPTVVFDLDGTLVDSAGAIASIINDMRVEGHQPRLSMNEMRPYATSGGAAMAEALLAGAWGDASATLTTFRERYSAAPTPSDSVYPGVRQALIGLDEVGFQLAVFSNKIQGLFGKVLGDLGLAQFFAAIVGTGPDTPHKPDSTGYFQVLDRAGGTFEQSCLAGDSEADEATAIRAGDPLICAAWGYGQPSEDSAGPLCAEAFVDIPALAPGCLTCREPA